MVAMPPNYDTGTLYGPFPRRVEHPRRGDLEKAAARRGDLGLRTEWGGAVAARAYSGPLENGDEGIEFWTFAKPDRPHGPVGSWSNAGEHVRIENEEVAKVKVAITRVSRTMIEALNE